MDNCYLEVITINEYYIYWSGEHIIESKKELDDNVSYYQKLNLTLQKTSLLFQFQRWCYDENRDSCGNTIAR